MQASHFLHCDRSCSAEASTAILWYDCSQLACLAEEAVLLERDMTLTSKSLVRAKQQLMSSSKACAS